MQIYIVEKMSGSYEDSCTVAERAFVSEDDARAFADGLNEENKKIQEAYDMLSDSGIFYDDVITDVFNRKLEETEPEFHAKLNAIWGKVDTSEPLTDEEHDVVERYECGLDEYTRNYDPEEFFKYAKELGFDDETVEALFRSAPFYTDYSCYDLPYYIVSRPIELVGVENKEIQTYH